ncbi:hypothetical protein GGR57DRAFT_512068 [Xylariaceae sp. FL1272]|nr:hypothetical protein GGR57DRAFT_512068 [Xylariaceae sp. FL1272]
MDSRKQGARDGRHSAPETQYSGFANRRLVPGALDTHVNTHQGEGTILRPRLDANDAGSAFIAVHRYASQQRLDSTSRLVQQPFAAAPLGQSTTAQAPGPKSRRAPSQDEEENESEDDPEPVYIPGPGTAYGLYRQSRNADLVAEGLLFEGISVVTGQEWQRLTPEEQAPWMKKLEEKAAECRRRGWNGKNKGELAKHKRRHKEWEERQAARRLKAVEDQKKGQRTQRGDESRSNTPARSQRPDARAARHHPYQPSRSVQRAGNPSGVPCLARRGEMSGESGRDHATEGKDVAETPQAPESGSDRRNVAPFGPAVDGTQTPAACESAIDPSLRHQGYGNDDQIFPQNQNLNEGPDPSHRPGFVDDCPMRQPNPGSNSTHYNGAQATPQSHTPSPVSTPLANTAIGRQGERHTILVRQVAAPPPGVAVSSHLEVERAEHMPRVPVADMRWNLRGELNQNVGSGGNHHRENMTTQMEVTGLESTGAGRGDATLAAGWTEITGRTASASSRARSQERPVSGEQHPLFFGEAAKHERAWERFLTSQWRAHK